jgi:IS30 family transposase
MNLFKNGPLSNEQRKRIITLHHKGLSHRVIAARLNVGKRTVGYVLHGRAGCKALKQVSP